MAEILIVYASFGQGHKKAAQALSYLGDSSCYDLLEFTHPVLKKIYSLSYVVVTKHFPCFWKALFYLAKKKSFASGANKFNRLIFAGFLKHLEATRPKIIIVTHFFPSSLVEAVKDEYNCKVISLVTDLRAHPLWVSQAVDHYFVAVEETRDDLLKLGVEPEKIITGFVPLREGFLESFSKEDLKDKFNFDSRPVVSFISSLRGKFPFLKAVLPDILARFNIFVICGNNKKLTKYLKALGSEHIRFFSFYEQIWELICLSSVLIAKPGGLSVFEGLYLKKPFIFTYYIPGQEKSNMELLIKHDIARFARNKKELLEAIDYFERKYSSQAVKYPIKLEDIRKPLNQLIQKLANA
jgi:processive 1,2-diacylglycerol beta-glucosyltransferase